MLVVVRKVCGKADANVVEDEFFHKWVAIQRKRHV